MESIARRCRQALFGKRIPGLAAIMPVVLACALALPRPAFAGLRLVVEQRPAEVPDGDGALRGFAEQALSNLPPRMRDTMDRDITIGWDARLPADVPGRSHGGTVRLNPRYREDAGRMLATLLHELTHVYDRRPGGGRRLSTDPRLLDLAGWQVKVHRRAWRERHNRFADRSPDRYELQSPAEFVAVNMEHFLLDPAFACRRPALYRYLRSHFDWAPANAVACAATVPLVGAGRNLAADAIEQLDPARVHAIDYLLADRNDQPMSRWGHSMLRLVVCAPGRAPGPDCRLDLEHHRVLSFRAFIDDLQISSWRGLTGSYPSRLFVLPLAQVVEEYTRVELRGLQSVPLRLSPAEISGLLERAAQLHWTYDGRYYFVSNNCAVETFKLLHDGIRRLANNDLDAVTPIGLMHNLVRSGVADVSVLADPATALREGYRFDSLLERFDVVYAAARQSLALPSPDAKAWMALSPQQRAPWLERGGLEATAALLLLEQAALRRERARVTDELKHRYLPARRALPPASGDILRTLVSEVGYLSRPAELLDGVSGYGLPQAEELAVAAADAGKRRVRLQELETEIEHLVAGLLEPRQRQQLQATVANVDRLGMRLSALHAGQGGILLP